MLGGEQSPYLSHFQTSGRKTRQQLTRSNQDGHISAALVQLANASYRLGRALRFDPQTEQVIGDDEANNLLRDGDRGYIGRGSWCLKKS